VFALHGNIQVICVTVKGIYFTKENYESIFGGKHKEGH
jgi:hypothetical protein